MKRSLSLPVWLQLEALLTKVRWMAVPVLCLVCVEGFAELELKGTPADLATVLTNVPRIAQITGESEVKVQADRALLTVKISTSARELGAALRANQQVRTKFSNLLTAQGIAADQIKASKFSSTEKYGVFSDKVKSHRVNNLLTVNVKNDKEFQVVADAVDSLPEAQYLGVEFERSDKEDMKAKAIAYACKNADLRKKVFEDLLGLKLTVRRFYDPDGELRSGAPVLTSGLRAMGGTAPSFNGVTLSGYVDESVTKALAQREDDHSGFGELTFRSRVTVEYSVESK